MVYDRTGTNVGTFTLYVDGFLISSVASVAMDVSQTSSLQLGGHSSTSASLDRWFDGQLDDVLFQSGLNGRAEIWGLSHFSTRHHNGLSASATVTVNVNGLNQPPAITDVPNQNIPVSGATGPLPFTVSDAETEARVLIVSATSSNPSVLPQSGIAISPAPTAWANSDIGAVGAVGSLIEDHGTFIVGGAGTDIGGTTDAFRWVRQDLSGDGEIVARVVSLDYTNQDAKAGVMMRSAATPTAPYAYACVTAGNGVSFQYRATDSGTAATNLTINRVAAPVWLRLTRAGSNFTAQYATDNAGVAGPWQALGTTQPITFGAAPNAVGLAVTSKVDATVCTAVFDKLGGTVKRGGERTITLTPTTGVAGSSTVTLNVSDGPNVVSDTIALMVGSNTAPTISSVSNINVTDGGTIAPFVVTLSDVHTPVENLTFTVNTTNPAILPLSRVEVTGSGATRTITLRPVASELGTVSVSLQVSDGALTGTTTFNVTVAAGDPTFAARRGANWRYFANGGSPGGGWTGTSFNDGAWSRAPGELGYGDGDESTVIPGGSPGAQYITSYFRRTFQIPTPSLIAQAAIRLRRDDGAIVYLNGTELFRDNMPAGAVTTITPALSDISGGGESAWLVHRFDPARLVAGTNTLAVEVHQSSATSDDVSFDLELLAFAHSAIPTLSLAVQSADLKLLWPTWASGWQLKGGVDFASWSPVAGTPTDNGRGPLQVVVPLSGAPRFFRLEAP